MDTHVKVLGALQIALGALSLFAAFVLLVVFIGGASVVRVSGDPDAQIALPIIGITGTALVTLLVVLSLPSIVTGIGLLRLRPWARIVGIVVSVFSLTLIPFGTIVGVYGLWVLFSRETEQLFTAQAPSATAV
jgi:hypothetical protein